ncbi:single-stranded DNA-binding protein [Gudongella sp. SC589]|uniref:single-stranded DNA-binding protein n=1 Tax=Gudongella sp. SC589 TaxID=3385990 RepID=UPI003904BC21
MNLTIISGRTTKDIELKYLPNGGTAVANFTLAVDRDYSKEKKAEMESQNKPTVDFINVVAFGKTAEFVANYLQKGKRVAVQGRIETGSYTNKDGHKVYTTTINANNVEIIDWPDKQEVPEGFTPADNQDVPF